MAYSVWINGTGCYSALNQSRAENGQDAEEHMVDDMTDALEMFGAFRSGEIYDEYGDLVAKVRNGHAYDPDGDKIEAR